VNPKKISEKEIYEIVIETENDASDRTRGRFERNKPEMFQYLRKFIPTFLDKIFSELGEKTLSVIGLPTYFFQTSAKKAAVGNFTIISISCEDCSRRVRD